MARTNAATVLMLLLVLPPLTAQIRIKVKQAGTLTPLQQHIVELTMPERRRSAMLALWSTGGPAVPLLAAEVERAGAGAQAALAVLERLGGEAAAAAPVLWRTAASSSGAWQARLRAVAAAIDGPPCILVCLHKEGAVVQVDFDGNTVRKLACSSAFGVWPLPDDRVAVLQFDEGKVGEWNWDGTAGAAQSFDKLLTTLHQLDDGDRLVTNWVVQNGGRLTRLGPDATVRWQIKVKAFRLQRACDETLFVTTREPATLRSFTPNGEPLQTVPLPSLCHGFRLLSNGNVLLAAHDEDQLLELDPGGKVVREIGIADGPTDVHRLHDGRTVVACSDGLVLLAADGRELWRRPIGDCGPLFVRAPAATGGSSPVPTPSGR